jgi:alpha-L-fucosidase 2
MTWFTIDYRLAPQHRWPAQIEDLNAAIRWVKDNARRYKVDPRRVALVGESAGGHMVAYAAAKNRGKEAVAAVVCFYGPTDLEKREIERQGPHKNLRQLLGISDLGEPARKALREASPITWVHRGMPPVLFIHGTADQAVPFEQSPAMCEAMKKVGGKCEVVRVEGAPHGIGAWEKSPEFQAYKGKMIAWLKQALGGSENETGRR